MLVGDALTELRGSILRDTSSLAAGVADTLWTNDQLCLYMNEAQNRFARKTMVLRDAATPAVTRITLVAGQSEYPLHTSVLSVLSARYAMDTLDLPRAGHITLDTRQTTESPWFDVNAASQALPPGRPMTYTVDQAFRSLRIYPTPTAVEAGNIVYLRVARMPVTPITSLNLFNPLEIPEEYQIEMLEWAAYKALSNHDADAHIQAEGQPFQVAADKHKANFEAAVAEAIREIKRTMFSPVRFDFSSVPGLTYAR